MLQPNKIYTPVLYGYRQGSGLLYGFRLINMPTITLYSYTWYKPTVYAPWVIELLGLA